MRKTNRSEKILIGLTIAVVILAAGLGAVIFFGAQDFASHDWMGEVKEPEVTPQFSTRSGLEDATVLTTTIATTTTPATTVPEDPTPTAEDVAHALLTEMTLEEKIGQLLLARCPGEDAADMLADYPVGGYVLFGVDFEDKSQKQVKGMLKDIQAAAKLPLLLAVDEEGGTVVRVSANPKLREPPFAAPQQLYQKGGLDLVREDAAEKSAFLLDLGLNVNLAPVADVSQSAADFIYLRTVGQDAATTAEYVRTVVEAMRTAGCGSCLKHFPGYGNNVDTHTHIAQDLRPMETFRNSDFLPFEAGIRAGASMVMVAHNVVAAMDPDVPASLSPAVHQILREELGFTGVIVTDDLAMEGVKAYATDIALPVMALQAGNDMLCVTDIPETFDALLDAIEAGDIKESELDAAVLRILLLKIELGLIEIPEN